MRARAPGKIVLSGAYAVLEGAPAVVAAVDRYVTADTSRPAERVTPEVRAALGDHPAPWFDASALREGDRKLGLGSSAAILVASLGAVELEGEPGLDTAALRERVFSRALQAHRQAQGGGSGIDVAASVHGGVLIARRAQSGLELTPVELPAGLTVCVLSARASASTPDMVRRVQAWRERDPTGYQRVMSAQGEASEDAARALLEGDASGLVMALNRQLLALSRLGAASGAPIVTHEIAGLAPGSEQRGAAILPAGAGGGDVAIWVAAQDDVDPGPTPGLARLDLRLGAEGLAADA